MLWAGYVGGLLLLTAWHYPEQRGPGSAENVTHPAEIHFRDRQPGSGIDFVLENAPTAKKHLVETMAGGVAAFDYDGDGRTDLFFANGAALPGLRKSDPRYNNRLYRNLGGFHFEDVTSKAGVAGEGYSMAAAAGDYDNDGHVDLFVGGVGKHMLYRNRGDVFHGAVTAKAGITGGEWAAGALWVDYDQDGRLDLFVVNYVRWSPEFDRVCGPSGGTRVYCHPRFFEGLANRLYRNQGDGTFKDVSVESGIASHTGKGMAAAAADYDRDGRPDIFVTNDKMPNFLFHNLGGGKFEEVAFDRGVALVDSGSEISGMGADFRDYDNDGFPDILTTALSGETFPLFQNRAGKLFVDAGHTSGLGVLSRKYSGWGTGLFDFNNDGWKDIFAANAHVDDNVEAFEATEYKQHNAIFVSRGNDTFQDASTTAGPEFQARKAHRGCAFADLDNDGRVDVVVSVLGERPEIWQNVTEGENGWLALQLRGTRSNRDGIGAEVRIGTQFNTMTTAVGYASSSHSGVHFGTGAQKQLDRVEIRWPSGTQQQLTHVQANQVLAVREPE